MGGLTQRPWTPTKRRAPIAAEFNSPGPACVSLPNLVGSDSNNSKRGRAPSYSFGSRHDNKNDSPGPGPGQYNVTGLSAKGKDSPQASTLHSRPKDPKNQPTPAPGEYNPEKCEKVIHDNSPKYTFGLKTPMEKPSTTPGPNVYNIPTAIGQSKEGNMKTAPAYSISGRQKEPLDERVLTPGPGTYNDSSPENYKTRRPPSYTISARYQLPSDDTQKPGPGAYVPEKVTLDTKPAHTFGIRHSPYIGYLKDAIQPAPTAQIITKPVRFQNNNINNNYNRGMNNNNNLANNRSSSNRQTTSSTQVTTNGNVTTTRYVTTEQVQNQGVTSQKYSYSYTNGV